MQIVSRKMFLIDNGWPRISLLNGAVRTSEIQKGRTDVTGIKLALEIRTF